MSPSTAHTISLGEIVRYPDPPNETTSHVDGYRNFFHLTAMPENPRLIMNRGVDHPAWVAAPGGRRRPVILIRSNPLRAGTRKTPWEDVFDMGARHVHYYGDHKSDSVGPPESTRGNAALLAAYEEHQSENDGVRARAAPLLIFRSVERNNQAKGYLEFCGLGLISQATAVEQQDPSTTQRFSNYVYDIDLLDLSTDGNQLDWRWINDRRDHCLSNAETNRFAPAVWRSWVSTGTTRASEAGARMGERSETVRRTDGQVGSLDWTWDELILACAVVYRNDWHEVKKHDRRALDLSNLLQLLPIHPVAKRRDDFRNPNSVQRKTADLATAHPNYHGKKTKGGRLTEEIVKRYIKNPDEMLAIADQITHALTSGEPGLLDVIAAPDRDEEDMVAVEGRILERVHRFRERDARLREEKIRAVLCAGGTLSCEVCEFNFAQCFGKHGSGYIEVHHRVPLHEAGTSQTRLVDLALLCANCHRMSHRRLDDSGTWPSVQELRNIVLTSDM